jgi:type IV fimbrial biogenesis protein FimT
MGKKHLEGFTLIELLMLVMVLALTLGLGVPALTSMAANGRMTVAANDLVGSIQAARAQASTRSMPVTLCASSDWGAADPGCAADASLLDGWIVFEDADGDAEVDPGETVLQAHGPVDDSIRGQARSAADGGTPQFLSFRADGFPATVAGRAGVRNIQLCDPRGDHDTGGGRAAGRWISISPAGHSGLADQVSRLQGPANPMGGC